MHSASIFSNIGQQLLASRSIRLSTVLFTMWLVCALREDVNGTTSCFGTMMIYAFIKSKCKLHLYHPFFMQSVVLIIRHLQFFGD